MVISLKENFIEDFLNGPKKIGIEMSQRPQWA